MRHVFRRSRVTLAVSGLVTMVGGVVGLALPASAHTATVSGTATCASDGSLSVAWSITSDWGTDATISALTLTPNGTLTGLTNGETLPANGTIHGSSTGTTGTTATLSVHAKWSDYEATFTGSAVHTGTCPTPPPTGALSGHIYDCSAGSTTTNEVSGGTLGATGAATYAPAANPMSQPAAPTGGYTVTATPPASYHLVACGPNGTTSSTRSVTVTPTAPGSAIFYVARDVGGLNGHIYDCSAGSATTNEVSGGTIGATGAATYAPAANPMSQPAAPTGGYTVTATAPTGYHLVACGTTPPVDTRSVTVTTVTPGSAIFYVAQDTGNLTGHIYACSAGSATTTEVIGTMGATGPQTVSAAPNPLSATGVATGVYTVTATPPANYHLVSCVPNGSSSNTRTTTVTTTTPGSTIFYVARDTGTLAGHIYACSGNLPTTNEVAGGTLGATGPQTVTAVANPISVPGVLTGAYTVTVTPPPSYQLVACGTTTSAPTQAVTVPSNGTGTAVFYVAPIPVIGPPPAPSTLIGHIYDCSSGTTTTTEVPGGTLGATGPQTVGTAGNPMSVTVAPGDYTVTAAAPTGYQLVSCAGSASGTTAPVHVPSGGQGVAIFYVAQNSTTPPTTPPTTGSGTPPVNTVAPSTAAPSTAAPSTASAVLPAQGATSPATPAAPTVVAPAQPTVLGTGGARLPFTGAPVRDLVVLGLALLLLGSAALMTSRRAPLVARRMDRTR